MSLKEKIKRLRKAKNMQQKKLALLLGVNQATVSYWESGRQEPNTIQRKKLCNIFGISEAELFDVNYNPEHLKNRLPVSLVEEDKVMVLIRFAKILERITKQYPEFIKALQNPEAVKALLNFDKDKKDIENIVKNSINELKNALSKLKT